MIAAGATRVNDLFLPFHATLSSKMEALSLLQYRPTSWVGP
jgi:hypothetical protein